MIPLIATPDDFRRITDDGEAKMLLIEFGLLEKLLEYGKGKRPSLTEKWSARLYYTDHPTHWLIADHFSGFANPADNGFVVDCIPKSRFSLEQLRQLERQQAATRFPNDIDSSESGTILPPQN